LAESDLIDVPALEELIGDNAGQSSREVDKMAKLILALPNKLGSKLDVIERAVLHHAIEMCSGNKSAAARLIGVHRKSLDRRLDRLSEPDIESDGNEG
jgi:two-component system response regulator HydG